MVEVAAATAAVTAIAGKSYEVNDQVAPGARLKESPHELSAAVQ